MIIKVPKENSGAYFSALRRFRYCLWRIWDRDKPLVMIIGLNPSKANETENDRTISRIINFAKDWGYGGVYMLNLIPYISTDPDAVAHSIKPHKAYMIKNISYLKFMAARCKDIVFAWGAHKVGKIYSLEVIQMFPNAKVIRINADGSPAHPLYLPGDSKLSHLTYKELIKFLP